MLGSSIKFLAQEFDPSSFISVKKFISNNTDEILHVLLL